MLFMIIVKRKNSSALYKITKRIKKFFINVKIAIDYFIYKVYNSEEQ